MEGAAEQQENWRRLVLLLEHASVVLQRLFHSRWLRIHGSPWNEADNKHAKECFLMPCGRGYKMHKSVLNRVQRDVAVTGVVSDWDISLLAHLLLHLDWSCAESVMPSKRIKEENAAVQQIRQARNSILHTTDAKTDVNAFVKLWQQLCEALILLGEGQAELDKIKTKTHLHLDNSSPSCSPETLRKAAELKSRGNTHYKKKEAMQAIECYSQALKLNELANHDRALLFSNRAAAHMLISGDEDKAFTDAKQAVKLSPYWAKGYYRKGKALMALQQYQKATKVLLRGKAITPTSDEIDNALAECKHEEAKLMNNEYLNKQYLPPQLDDIRQEFIEQFGKGTDVLDHLDKMIETMEAVKMHAEANMIKSYRATLQPCPDDNEIARYVYQAAEQGCADGMFNMGLLHLEGKGVLKDASLAVYWLKKAVNQPLRKYCNINRGVLEAKDALGKLYLSGHGIDKNIELGLRLLKQAADGGIPSAQNQLGALYMKGDFVPKDRRQAYEYHLAAANGGHNVAMMEVANFYRLGIADIPRDLLKAKQWIQRSFSAGNIAAELELKEIESCMESELEEMKRFLANNRHDEETGEATLARILHDIPDGLPEVIQDIEKFKVEHCLLDKPRCRATEKFRSPYRTKLLQELAANSSTAAALLQAYRYFKGALKVLHEVFDLSPPYPMVMFLSIVHLLAKAYAISELVVRTHPDERSAINVITKEVLEDDKSNQGAHIVLGYMNMDEPWIVDYLEQRIKDFPKNYTLLQMYGNSLCFANRFEEGVHVFTRCIKMAPDDVECLFLLAGALKLLPATIDSPELQAKAIRKYKKYLAVCAPDARKVPEAHYSIGRLYMYSGDLKKMQEYYQLGLDAEKQQLPFYLPYYCPEKEHLKLMLTLSVKSQPFKKAQRTRKKDSASGKAQSAATPTNRELYIRDVSRKQIRLQHRRLQQDSFSQQPYSIVAQMTRNHGAKQQRPKQHGATPSRQIVLSDMEPTIDLIYNGCAMQVVFIEVPITVTAVQSVIQDCEGRVQRCSVYNLPSGSRNRIRVGQLATIINPYMRMATDGKPAIRIDDPSCLVFGEKLLICHYCGQQSDALSNCGRCKAVQYCSKDCQIADWTELEHKTLCRLLLGNVTSP